jgi:hypothetical protein
LAEACPGFELVPQVVAQLPWHRVTVCDRVMRTMFEPGQKGTGIDSSEKFCGLLGRKDAIRGIDLIGGNGFVTFVAVADWGPYLVCSNNENDQADLSANPPFPGNSFRFAKSGL